MQPVSIFLHTASVMLCWSSLRAVQHSGPAGPHKATTDAMKFHGTTGSAETGDGPEMMRSFPGAAGADGVPERGPCFLNDVFAVVHDALAADDEPGNSSLTLFGICAESDNSTRSVLSDLAEKTGVDQQNQLEVLHPSEVSVVEEEGGALTLTLDFPPSPLPSRTPVLLLVFGSPATEEDLGVAAFSSDQLQPRTQRACISEGTQYVLLTGKTSQRSPGQKWSISVETKSPDIRRQLKEPLIDGSSHVDVSVTPFLLFFGETGSDARNTDSRQTFYFLCELRRFLVDVLPQAWPGSAPLRLDSLQSLPSLPLGLSSSEMLLATLINSTSPTVFSFSSSRLHRHRGELALPAALQEELWLRLQQSAAQIRRALEAGDHTAVRRLGRLQELTASPRVEPTSGVSQYRRFLLLKALQTVGREIKRQLRAARAEPSRPERGSVCGLRTLTVSLDRYLACPNTANINNCQGSCAFPMVTTNNHAILLTAHIESSGDDQQRSPCCVPVLYDSLEVVDVNDQGTFLTIKPDMVAKKCECR